MCVKDWQYSHHQRITGLWNDGMSITQQGPGKSDRKTSKRKVKVMFYKTSFGEDQLSSSLCFLLAIVLLDYVVAT